MSTKAHLLLLLFVCLSTAAMCAHVDSDYYQQIERTYTGEVDPRKKKNKKLMKYLLPIAMGALVIKALLFPLAVKMMAVMSFVSMLMSGASIIISALAGFTKDSSHPSSTKRIQLNGNEENLQIMQNDRNITDRIFDFAKNFVDIKL